MPRSMPIAIPLAVDILVVLRLPPGHSTTKAPIDKLSRCHDDDAIPSSPGHGNMMSASAQSAVITVQSQFLHDTIGRESPHGAQKPPCASASYSRHVSPVRSFRGSYQVAWDRRV